ncbi:cytosine permease [Microbulbifer sp. SSSA005]|uniref:cytosine permease n=1 Tax=Microbulbifer sp. SSSA005 TaxID=3243378 RepID=UPI00403A597A
MQLKNENLAVVKPEAKRWGTLTIFNLWANAAQSLAGYTLAATLFLGPNTNAWLVLAGIAIAAILIIILLNLIGEPSVKYGIPFPVLARASMGIRGANVPALLRGSVAIFWYGAQTWFAAHAMSLLLREWWPQAVGGQWLAMDRIDWASLVLVSLLQALLFFKGINTIRWFINLAAPCVYGVMLALLWMLVVRSDGQFSFAVATFFDRSIASWDDGLAQLIKVTGTMLALYAPIILSYGDFARFCKNVSVMRRGNWLGITINMTGFAIIVLFTAIAAQSVFHQNLANPTDIVQKLGNLELSLIAAVVFFTATAGINVVANFVAPVNDISNLLPKYLGFRRAALITLFLAFLISALWPAVIKQIGLVAFVNWMGVFLAPAYGVILSHYYLIEKRQMDVGQLYYSESDGRYYYFCGWNPRALLTLLGTCIVITMLAFFLPRGLMAGVDWLLAAAAACVVYWSVAKRS